VYRLCNAQQLCHRGCVGLGAIVAQLRMHTDLSETPMLFMSGLHGPYTCASSAACHKLHQKTSQLIHSTSPGQSLSGDICLRTGMTLLEPDSVTLKYCQLLGRLNSAALGLTFALPAAPSRQGGCSYVCPPAPLLPARPQTFPLALLPSTSHAQSRRTAMPWPRLLSTGSVSPRHTRPSRCAALLALLS
jgi:hypothetical protein